MHVLIVDDDRSTRYLINRALTKRFACEVSEAVDGRQALDFLAKSRCDLAILDVQMPVMDGLETLRVLRHSPQFSSMPVVMLTGERDEIVIREILELGVLEYLAKPLNIPRLAERLRRILRAIRELRARGTGGGGGLHQALCDQRAPILIVDGRTPFRRCFVQTLRLRRPVVEVATGVGALREMAASPPAAVFVGSDLGVLGESLFLRRLRSSPACAGLPAVALVDDEEEGDARLVEYDGTLTRTLVAETLLRRFADLIRLTAASGWELPQLPPGFRATMLLICEEVLGTALASDVTLCDLLPFVAPVDRLTASGSLHVSPDSGVRLEVMCDFATARRAACNLFGVDGRLVDDESSRPAVERVFGMLRERLSAVYGTQADELEDLTLTRTSSWAAPPLGSSVVTLCFQAPARDHGFWIVLTPVRT